MRFFLVLALSFFSGVVLAQSHSQFFDYTGYNAMWNGSNWVSYASGYGNVLGPDTTTGDFTVYTTGNAASAGLTRTLVPVMSVGATGTVSASRFVGDGSGLTNLSAGSVSVTDGLSGSLVFRDGLGALHGHPGISVSSTTGSVGIGAGAPATVGNSGLYVSGSAQVDSLYLTGNKIQFFNDGVNSLRFKSSSERIDADSSVRYLLFATSGTEAMRIVSNGYVGIGRNPKATLDVGGHIGLPSEGNLVGFGVYYDGVGATFRNRDAGKFVAMIRIGQSGVGEGGDIQFNTDSSATAALAADTAIAPARRMVIRRAGDVRIAKQLYIGDSAMVTTPTVPLEVAGTVSATNIKTAGTMTVGMYSSQPVACSAGYTGMVAMSSTLKDLCLCDGTNWVAVGHGGTVCTW